MKCVNCGDENPSEALFCMKCRTKFEKKCPRCDLGYKGDALYCIKCGDPLTEIKTSEIVNPNITNNVKDEYIGENRPITALFFDISNSTEFFSGKSHEEILEFTIDFFSETHKIIEKYGGNTGSSPAGDGQLAIFGYPNHYEDHADRAILSAIDIIKNMQKKNLGIRIGISTGIVSLDKIETVLQSQMIHSSIEIILAKRLQEAAKPDQILISSETYNYSQSAFDFETIPPLNLKGFSNSVSAYSVVCSKVHPHKSRGKEGLRTEFIGRKRELNDLIECVDNLLSHKGQIVSVIGEAGIGKTRLIEELKNYIKDNGIIYLEGSCMPVRQSTPYWVFIDMLRNYLGFTENDTSKEMADKIADNLKFLFPLDWEEKVPYIGMLLSVKFGNEWDEVVKYLSPEHVRYPTDEVKFRISWILVEFFVALAKNNPLLLIFDDLHWTDDSSLDLLSLLMDEIYNVSIMLLCIYRQPEMENRRWNIGIQASSKCHDRYKDITLHELTPDESQKLLVSLESMLHNISLPEKLRAEILQKTEGNPLFLLEFICSIVDKNEDKWTIKGDIDNIKVPNKLQDVIMTQINGLKEEVRHILQYASAMEMTFQYKLMQHIMLNQGIDETQLSEYLWQLEKSCLIYKEHTIPELEYKFRHVIDKETIYNSMLLRQRKDLHSNIGMGIENIYRNRIEEFYGELYWHYSQSGNIPKTIDFAIKSGNKAKIMYSNKEAIDYFEKALKSIQSLPEDDEHLSKEIIVCETLGDIFFTIGEHNESKAKLDRALEMAYKTQDIYHVAKIKSRIADLVHWQGDFVKAIEIAKSGLDDLVEQKSNPEAVSLLEILSRSYRANGDLKTACYYADQIAEMLHEIPYFDSIYKAYYEFAFIEIVRGKYDSAKYWLEEMERVCLENNDAVGLARCYHGMSELFWWDDLAQANYLLEKSLSYCEKVGEAHLLMEGHLEMAHHLIMLNVKPDQIESHIHQGLEIAEQMAKTSKVASAPELFKILGDAYKEKGDNDKAIIYYDRAIEFGLDNSNLGI